MRPYEEFADEVGERQCQALRWAAAARLRRTAAGGGPRRATARMHLAMGLRRLAGWVEGPGAVTLRAS